MGTLKEDIQREVHLLEPITLEKYLMVARKVESKNIDNRRTTTNNYKDKNVPSSNPP